MARQIQSSRTKSFLLLLITVVIGVGLNFLGRLVNELLRLPLYLDNVGTLLSAMTGGLVPGITVGFFSNLINGLNDPNSTYYAVISILIAVTVVICKKRGMMTRLPQVLLAVVFFALIGGGLGGLLTWLIYGKDFGEGYAVDLAARLADALTIGYVSSNLLSNVLVDLVDKLIVTAVSVPLYLLMPEKLHNLYRSQSWYLRRNTKGVAHIHKRSTLTFKMAAAIMTSIAVAMLGAITTSIVQYHKLTLREYEEKGERVTALLAEMLDRQAVESLLAEGRDAAPYEGMTQELENVTRTSPEVRFIYAYQVRENDCVVVYDLDVPDQEADDPGTVVEHDGTITKYTELFLAGEEIPSDATTDLYGWLYSVYRPVYDTDGTLLCYAIADMSMDRLSNDEIAYLTKLISIFIAFLFLTSVYSVWLTRQTIIEPVNTIANAANSFSYDTPEARVQSRKMVEELDITTGDEIEDLYRAYRKTTEDMVDYIDEVQHKSDQISNLQNGLILVLADMVESRDKNTGDHVKKTAAYVAIILEQMRKEGIYADKLTDSYIYDVVHSAPLHDVGKITISDAILNKPGKLTDDEFTVMKTHAVSGEVIIDQVIDTMREESNYLNEAKNLAAFHHEKWNGQGYPKGLKGEEIPLSARVMAVADVFDALVSRRSYKGPYSIEKSLDIIRESSGSHFDPLVVKAFLDAEPEVRRVATQNMSEYDYKQHNL